MIKHFCDICKQELTYMKTIKIVHQKTVLYNPYHEDNTIEVCSPGCGKIALDQIASFERNGF